ncbi:DUF2071 domain-containing protein [Candidatus Sumerlaeota bacterium]|nr:DUF2071 domain-containing protein [Candidatus Sumerlaeota bacterium]MBI3736713.1 DUF2071 domain-containing protein [Candidatus Sumerlaeota bacterium]
MRIPSIRGVIDRRILVNYQIDPGILAKILPPPFRPKTIHGMGVGGVCLIRLRDIRPQFMPRIIGLSSENAAHRIAVEWNEGATTREGVFVPRRDTNSRLNTLVGGRLFPGIHHPAVFTVRETENHFSVALHSTDGQTSVEVEGDVASELPKNSLFASLDEASEFFRRGSIGYSATPNPNRFDGLELACQTWHIAPLDVAEVKSSFFENGSRFPPGSAQFDCALVMRNIQHEWRGRSDLCAE